MPSRTLLSGVSNNNATMDVRVMIAAASLTKIGRMLCSRVWHSAGRGPVCNYCAVYVARSYSWDYQMLSHFTCPLHLLGKHVWNPLINTLEFGERIAWGLSSYSREFTDRSSSHEVSFRRKPVFAYELSVALLCHLAYFVISRLCEPCTLLSIEVSWLTSIYFCYIDEAIFNHNAFLFISYTVDLASLVRCCVLNF